MVVVHIQITTSEEQRSSVCHRSIQVGGDCVAAAATPSHGAIPAQALWI